MFHFAEEKLKENQGKIDLRLNQYKALGYDIEESRRFVLSCCSKVIPEILELGTGNGHMTIMLAQAGYSLTSLDCDPERQKIAVMRATSLGVLNKIKFMTGDAGELKFPDNSFSTVICADLWHHLSDHGKVLDEMLRVWNKKGNLVIADMDRKGLDIVAKIHASEGGFHDEGKVSIEKAGEFLAQKRVAFRKFAGHCQIVFVAEKE